MRYSLRNKNQERKNRKKTGIYLFLTIISIVLMFFVGVKVLVQIINTVTDLKQSDTINKSKDDIPPQTPRISIPTEFTKKKDIEIVGDGEPGSTILLYLNDKKREVIAGSEGKFVFKVDLIDGENNFYLKSEDSGGNVSSNTKTYSVTFDEIPPGLSVNSPSEGSTFYGSKNKSVEIKGQTDGDAEVRINDRFAYVSDNGSFNFLYELGDGENKIKIVAKDPAGNEVTAEITLNYQN